MFIIKLSNLVVLVTLAKLFATSSGEGLRQQRELQSLQQKTQDDNRALWMTHNPGCYRYNFKQECNNCVQYRFPWKVMMDGGFPAKAIDVKGKSRNGALSVAQIFDVVQAAITSPSDSITVEYDEIYGFPSSYRISHQSKGVETSTVYGFTIENGSPQMQLTENRQKWENQHILDYDFTYFEDGPNPQNIMWPLYVRVRGGSPIETRDRNGNLVTYLIPQTFDQYFSWIQNQINHNGFVDNEYSKRGYARDISMTSPTVGNVNIHFCVFKDVDLD